MKSTPRDILLLITLFHLGRALIFINTDLNEHLAGIGISWSLAVIIISAIGFITRPDTFVRKLLLNTFYFSALFLDLSSDVHWLLYSCPINYQQLSLFFDMFYFFSRSRSMSEALWALNEYLIILLAINLIFLLAYFSRLTTIVDYGEKAFPLRLLITFSAVSIFIGLQIYFAGALQDSGIGLIRSAWASHQIAENIKTEHVSLKQWIGENLPKSAPMVALDPEVKRRPNVLLIVFESTGARYLSTFSTADYAVPTPNLTELANVGLKAVNHYSVSGGASINCDWSIMTGLYPRSLGGLPVASDPQIAEKNVLSYFKQMGYRTGTFLDEFNLPWQHYKLAEQKAAEFSYDYEIPSVQEKRDKEERFQTLDALLRELDHSDGRPFLFYFRTYPAHYPYAVPKESQSKISFDRYRYLLRENDDLLGKIVAALKERRLFDNTFIMVTGDHGETFAKFHGLNVHSNQVYEELTRVPFVISYPPLLPRAKVIGSLTSHVDILPTLLAIMGGYDRDILELDGYDLFSTKFTNRSVFFTSSFDSTFEGMRQRNFKIITSLKEGSKLYDLSIDPTEMNDVSEANPFVFNSMLRAIKNWETYRVKGVGKTRKLAPEDMQMERRKRNDEGRFIN